MVIFLLIVIIIISSLSIYLFLSLETKIEILEDKLDLLSKYQEGWITLYNQGETRTVRYTSSLDTTPKKLKIY